MGLLRREVEKWVSFVLWFLLNCLIMIMSDDCGKKPEKKKKCDFFVFHFMWHDGDGKNSGSSWNNINFKKKLWWWVFFNGDFATKAYSLLKYFLFSFIHSLYQIEIDLAAVCDVAWYIMKTKKNETDASGSLFCYCWRQAWSLSMTWIFWWWWYGGLRQREENNRDFLLFDLREKKMTHSSS